MKNQLSECRHTNENLMREIETLETEGRQLKELMRKEKLKAERLSASQEKRAKDILVSPVRNEQPRVFEYLEDAAHKRHIVKRATVCDVRVEHFPQLTQSDPKAFISGSAQMPPDTGEKSAPLMCRSDCHRGQQTLPSEAEPVHRVLRVSVAEMFNLLTTRAEVATQSSRAVWLMWVSALMHTRSCEERSRCIGLH